IVQPILDMATEVGADGFCREQTAMIARPDSRRLLVEIDVPTVVIVGRQDQATPLPRAQEMAADIANARLVIIEECGHVAPLEKACQGQGIGKRLIEETRKAAGGAMTTTLLLSAPTAVSFYRGIKMPQADNCYLYRREK